MAPPGAMRAHGLAGVPNRSRGPATPRRPPQAVAPTAPLPACWAPRLLAWRNRSRLRQFNYLQLRRIAQGNCFAVLLS